MRKLGVDMAPAPQQKTQNRQSQLLRIWLRLTCKKKRFYGSDFQPDTRKIIVKIKKNV